VTLMGTPAQQEEPTTSERMSMEEPQLELLQRKQRGRRYSRTNPHTTRPRRRSVCAIHHLLSHSLRLRCALGCDQSFSHAGLSNLLNTIHHPQSRHPQYHPAGRAGGQDHIRLQGCLYCREWRFLLDSGSPVRLQSDLWSMVCNTSPRYHCTATHHPTYSTPVLCGVYLPMDGIEMDVWV
jgi:hypothetical protein